MDGQGGAETTSAIKRFQIRDGLQVTGTLTQETLNALSVSGQPAPAPPQPAKKAKSAITTGTPPPKVVESDKHLLDRVLHPPAEPQPTPVSKPAPPPGVAPETPEYSPPQRGVLPPPVDLNPEDAAGSMASFFARTPYENAPVSVQINTVRQAQSILRRRGYYNAGIDGDPGPGTQRALALFQRDKRLRPTGRLDTDTLLELDLMPGTLSPPALDTRIMARRRSNPSKGSRSIAASAFTK